MDNKLKTLPEFEEAGRQIIETLKVSEISKNIGLSSLLRLIMKKAPNNQISYSTIEDYVQRFIDSYKTHLTETPFIWNVQLSLKNIYIESNEIEIEQGVLLYRPTKEQLSDISPRQNNIDEIYQAMGNVLKIGAILSFSVLTNNTKREGLYHKEVSDEIARWLNVFRLFKPTDLSVIYQSVNPASIFEYSISENKEKSNDKFWKGKVEQKETSSYKFYLESDEEENFIAFVKNSKTALKEISQTNYLDGSSYNLAFHRYNDSLLKTEINAYKILSAITSLEALLSDGNTEITFRIRLRIAKLLSFFGYDSLDVSEKIKKAYSLRSKLVHGSPAKKLLSFARNHAHEILNYNRLCLLISLQLKNIKNKKELITLILDFGQKNPINQWLQSNK